MTQTKQQSQFPDLPEQVVANERKAAAILWHQQADHYEEAHALLAQSLELIGRHPYRAILLKRQSKLYRLEGQFDLAETALREALHMAEIHFGIIAQETRRLREKLCKAVDARFQSEPVTAIAEVEQYYGELIKWAGGRHSKGVVAVLKFELARYLAPHSSVKAVPIWEEILPILMSKKSKDELDSEFALWTLLNLGGYYAENGDRQKGQNFYAQAVKLAVGDARLQHALQDVVQWSQSDDRGDDDRPCQHCGFPCGGYCATEHLGVRDW